MDHKIQPLDVEYDSVAIIDALPNSERSTWKISEQLKEFLASKGIQQECAECSSKQGFFRGIEYFVNKASRGDLFCLHFICHGNSGGLGIKETGEYIPWEEFRDALASLNQSMNGRLMLNLSSCQGIHGVKIVDPTVKETPFFGLVGPKQKISVPDAIRVNEMFYLKQIEGFEIPEAVTAINREFGTEILYSITSEFYRRVKNNLD